MKFPFGKGRRHPIRRDKSGRSLRHQAFDLFDTGFRPSHIYRDKLVKASPRTLFRYYEDWKKENNRPSHSVLNRIVRRDPELSEESIRDLSEKTGLPVGEVLAWARQPWGMLQLFGEYIFGNSPKIIESLVYDIVLLRDNAGLEIRKERGVIRVITRYANGETAEKRLRCRTGELQR
jgi:hypothetical protein